MGGWLRFFFSESLFGRVVAFRTARKRYMRRDFSRCGERFFGFLFFFGVGWGFRTSFVVRFFGDGVFRVGEGVRIRVSGVRLVFAFRVFRCRKIIRSFGFGFFDFGRFRVNCFFRRVFSFLFFELDGRRL